MELQLIASNTPAAAMRPSEPVREGRATLSCRCEGCGSSVAFDALIVSCGCADDDRAADSTLH